MEKIENATKKTLDKRIKNGKYVLFFNATWCSDCNFIKPAMPDIVKDYPNYHFISVDRDHNMDLARDMNIFGIPSFVVFNNGKEIGRLVNKDRKTKDEIEKFLDSLK
ncbi:thiol reductase thioredoxin [Philodulcilactobacillus myokoensis]|uniref:Thiol reductase thioredoxin n=1 Tax=Philodulcilactobacillus myokoensis TaxID=2929573 RepID=A0A9W6B1D7_9LACO|nr:thioredoxin family protein [Philodulcilactobacillus myokoensis]GLB46741.1 thiol reductase thioredoxin [Philodulcilactobacillus myokoensis]